MCWVKICEATCDFCDIVGNNLQVQEIIDGWAECEARVIELENSAPARMLSCTSTYQP